MEKNYINFKNLEVLIMDEADKLLEDGHEVKINYLLKSFPK
jgi:superfamily II DNA/RNA helicase